MRAGLAVALPGIVVATILGPTPAEALIPPDTDCRAGPVAMTFDDGPHPEHTPRLLAVLRRHRAQATFYVQGRNAARHRRTVRRMVRDGHAVENHSWDHPTLTDLSSHQVRDQLARTSATIRRITGRTPKHFRPPYGATDARVDAIARDLGLRRQLWTIDTRDWTGASPRVIADRAIDGVRPHRRNVILMHDGVRASGNTVDAVGRIVRELRRRGHCLVPQQKMMAFQRPRARPRTFTEPRRRHGDRTIVIALDSPAQRRARVRVTTVDGSAVARVHFRPRTAWVRFARGQRTASITIRLLRVPEDGRDRAFRIRLSHPRHLTVAARHRTTRYVIVDRGPTVEPSPAP